jgi:hypothetical protein
MLESAEPYWRTVKKKGISRICEIPPFRLSINV